MDFDQTDLIQLSIRCWILSIDAIQVLVKLLIDGLNADLIKAFDDKEDLKLHRKKDNLANLSSALEAKESEFKKLSSVYEETCVKLSGSNSEIERLNEEVIKLEKDLELKSSNVDDLNAEIGSLCDAKNVISEELESVRKEYSDLKLSSEQKSGSDAKLLSERGRKIEELKEQLESALTTVDTNEKLISDLTNERDDLTKRLNLEEGKVENLEDEPLTSNG
ncbi:hypothetical protein LXL04_011053 [Taraxacum kok-saghyz]